MSKSMNCGPVDLGPGVIDAFFCADDFVFSDGKNLNQQMRTWQAFFRRVQAVSLSRDDDEIYSWALLV